MPFDKKLYIFLWNKCATIDENNFMFNILLKIRKLAMRIDKNIDRFWGSV